MAMKNITFKKSGEITWVSKSGTELRRFVRKGDKMLLDVKQSKMDENAWTFQFGGMDLEMPKANVKVEDLPKKKPTLRGGKKHDPYLQTIVVPLVVTFTTNPDELDDRANEPKPTKKSLRNYLMDAVVLNIDYEDAGQPEGAAFAAAAIDWDKAQLVKG